MSAQMCHTPLDLARQHGHGKVIEVLESRAMKEVSDDGVSVLEYMLNVMYVIQVHVYCSCTCTLYSMLFKHLCVCV